MPLDGKTSLILGVDGFLGHNMAEYFRRRGWKVHAVGRAAGDFSDPAVVQRVFSGAPKVDRIFHVITQQRTGNVQFGIQGQLLTVNARIHLNVLEAWAKHQPQAKLVSTGSSCAYPEMDRAIPEEAFQTGKLHPSVKGYGLAKQVLAMGSEAYAEQYKLKYLHCILATMFGPYDHKEPDRSHFMGGMIHRAASEKKEGRKEFSVWGSPKTVRELLYVDDQIEAILAADDKFENQLLNCAAGIPVTIEDAASSILEAMEWNAKLVFTDGTFKGAGYKMLDSSKFLGATGWKPKVPLAEGVRRVVEMEY